ncbi:hypothetical protein AG1IA_06667 [Rhizoctonia solani AG-1 IA]|uniref:Uncharacterized protein n=1 Tax=Thanatephorus cucumeris (strain AG1-IA) TaxID=983506 RepID=L8WME7_THACA|nr:hypothetical protein AG1IA_06667 [Rhizoctonia solani AG-1 IA]
MKAYPGTIPMHGEPRGTQTSMSASRALTISRASIQQISFTPKISWQSAVKLNQRIHPVRTWLNTLIDRPAHHSHRQNLTRHDEIPWNARSDEG